MLQAVIFDMDGLMVDSEPLAHRAWNDVLEPFGQRLDDATYSQLIGLRLDATARLSRDRKAGARGLRAIVEELAGRVEHWELAGEPEWIRASFVVGLKHLPVRYRIKPS